MPPCNCGGGKSGVQWQVTFSNGAKQNYPSVAAAHAAGKATGNTYTMKAVPK